ncbi:hypothetical protein BC835DRAFT_1346813 [Cytidiella melzeri]|nr:hypothetical protein BC835DRAFT_1346813 [Cytidiella melzeri]
MCKTMCLHSDVMAVKSSLSRDAGRTLLRHPGHEHDAEVSMHIATRPAFRRQRVKDKSSRSLRSTLSDAKWRYFEGAKYKARGNVV